MSTTDTLTGIMNRRGLEEQFPRALASARRDRRGLGIGLIDIDFFKLYNDTYGHQAGDLVLQSVASSIGSVLQRGHDHLSRFGGEEFCFFCLPESAAELERVAEKIRRAVESLHLEHAKNDAGGGIVTVSIGAYYLPTVRNETLDLLIRHADEMLYAAKAAGRNRCEVASAVIRDPKVRPLRTDQNSGLPKITKTN